MKKSMEKIATSAMILALAVAVSGCANVPQWCENANWCSSIFKRA